MDTCIVTRKFDSLGTRLVLRALRPRRHQTYDRLRSYTFDVRQGHDGGFFDLALNPRREVELKVLDCRPRERHLVLMVQASTVGEGLQTHRYLCGRDERDWFAAAIPDSARVTTVMQAREALKPRQVRHSQLARGVKRRDWNRRRNPGFVRQGEWFFVPAPRLVVDEHAVLRHEPLSRGGGKPHVAEFAYRWGGETVYVHRLYPQGVKAGAKARLMQTDDPRLARGWRVMVRDADVYVRGRVRHPDHKTVVLESWHRVAPNREAEAKARPNLIFLD